jgi:hypothetical protein
MAAPANTVELEGNVKPLVEEGEEVFGTVGKWHSVRLTLSHNQSG